MGISKIVLQQIKQKCIYLCEDWVGGWASMWVGRWVGRWVDGMLYCRFCVWESRRTRELAGWMCGRAYASVYVCEEG